MVEIWKEIKDTNKLYFVSNLGNVKSFKNGKEKILSKNINNSGYALVHIIVNGVHKNCTIHRLSALSFLLNPNNHPEVDHKDEDKSNNKLSNLQWISKKDHNIKSYDARVAANKKVNTGHTRTRGEGSGTSKLKNADVLRIRELYSNEEYNKADLSRMYNVSFMCITKIIRRDTWFHI